MAEPNFILKICLLGEANVGKTSLVYRFVENKFRNSYKATLGVNLLKKDLALEEHGNISAQIWDLGGQESFKSLRKLYLEGANGGICVYDVTNRKTFNKLDDWVESFKNGRGEQPLLLIGNKADLKNKIKVEEEEAKSFGEKNNMDLIITSAKTGLNVEEAFEELIRKIIQKVS
ncbi:MAG: GTP-binding protein [Candidatus Lokiarchaeota archaeon]|nr:GTP-binding protein [Candidatus Lokiarchaeota archaeon]MBD3198450.1 GTP-binding protein [Candidatus Lokiarchaeota archaeon]